jgi:glycerol-3-phosphate cytidylyltransferase
MYDISSDSYHNLFNQTTIEKIKQFKEQHRGKRIGFTASCFDLLHPGHILMLEDAHSKVDILIVALQTDPTINRSSKNKPVQTYKERHIMLNSVIYVDNIIEYATEDDLLNILKHLEPNLRILGSDWKGKAYTGHKLSIPVYFHERNHGWSTSNLRKRVVEAENNKQ